MIALGTTRPSSRPRSLPGFGHVNGYWDGTAQIWTAQVLPGEYYVSTSNEVITTVLGSCVSACVRDPDLGIGGINHFMLPGDPDPAGTGASARYGQFALERLLNVLVKHGGRREHFEVKIFGGGKVLPGLSDVGLNNVEFVRQFLAAEGLKIVGEDVLGNFGRRLRYHPLTGRAWVKWLPVRETIGVGRTESALRHSISSKAIAPSAAELF